MSEKLAYVQLATVWPVIEESNRIQPRKVSLIRVSPQRLWSLDRSRLTGFAERRFAVTGAEDFFTHINPFR